MNPLIITGPGGDILWVSGPLPDAVHDLIAARVSGILRELAASGLVMQARATPALVAKSATRAATCPPRRRRPNRAYGKLRSPGERANAQARTGASCADSAACLEGRAPGQGNPHPPSPRDEKDGEGSACGSTSAVRPTRLGTVFGHCLAAAAGGNTPSGQPQIRRSAHAARHSLAAECDE